MLTTAQLYDMMSREITKQRMNNMFPEYVNYKTENSDNKQNKKFWMITGDRNSPKVRHYNYEDALREANRLSRNNPGTEYFILEAVEKITLPTGVIREKL
jgi:hypothetical protein